MENELLHQILAELKELKAGQKALEAGQKNLEAAQKPLMNVLIKWNRIINIYIR